MIARTRKYLHPRPHRDSAQLSIKLKIDWEGDLVVVLRIFLTGQLQFDLRDKIRKVNDKYKQ